MIFPIKRIIHTIQYFLKKNKHECSQVERTSETFQKAHKT